LARLLASNAGLLLPSVLATVLNDCGFSAIQKPPVVKAIMRGCCPPPSGLSLTMGTQMAIPFLS